VTIGSSSGPHFTKSTHHIALQTMATANPAMPQLNLECASSIQNTVGRRLKLAKLRNFGVNSPLRKSKTNIPRLLSRCGFG
jgi:hypothetical protein